MVQQSSLLPGCAWGRHATPGSRPGLLGRFPFGDRLFGAPDLGLWLGAGFGRFQGGSAGWGALPRDGAGEEPCDLLPELPNLCLEIGNPRIPRLHGGLLPREARREEQEMLPGIGERPLALPRGGLPFALAQGERMLSFAPTISDNRAVIYDNDTLIVKMGGARPGEVERPVVSTL